MRRQSPTPMLVVVLVCAFALGIIPIANAQVIVGPNAIGYSSRNHRHLLAGADDYRIVDVEDAAPRISGYDRPNLGRRI